MYIYVYTLDKDFDDEQNQVTLLITRIKIKCIANILFIS